MPILLLSWILTFAAAISAQDRVLARFAFAPGAAEAEIEMRYEGCADDALTVAIPAWKPGSYTLRPFHEQLVDLTATDGDGSALAVEATDPNAWRIRTGGAGVVVVRYRLQTQRRGGAGPGFSVGKGLGRAKRIDGPDGERGPVVWPVYEFEGPATWLYVPGRLSIPHAVTFELPAAWRVATGMSALDDTGRHFGAADYDVFADCPFHVGEFEMRALDVDGVRYEIVWSGFDNDRNDRTAIVGRYERMVRAHHAFWGQPPFERYVFLIGFPGGGGLEHLNSTNIGILDLSGSREGVNSSWDSLLSHEFFHAWNVKRLRPQALGPFDYTSPNRTRYLWFCEGVTSYYGDLLLVRAGIWDARLFWERTVAGEVRALQGNPGRKKISIADASWTVWDFPYMRRGRTAPDYYNKGMLLGLLLDVEIRDATDGGRSLDDVMRALYAECTESGAGFADGAVRAACERASGRSFEDFFARYVDGTDELPFAEVLAKIGLQVDSPGVETAEEEAGSGDAPRRRRTWRLTLDDDAPERARRLRDAITARDG